MNEPTFDTFEGCIRNADNSGLGPSRIIGFFTEVSGRDAKEIPEFDATRYELMTLARHWAEIAIDIEYRWFDNEEDGRHDDRKLSFAWRRVKRIRNLLGEEVEAAVEEVCRNYGTKQDKMGWDAFVSWGGTSMTRRTQRLEVQVNDPI